MEPKLKIKRWNVWLMFLDQMPLKRFWRNLIKGHIRRKFNWRSHLRQNGEAKIMYNTKATAIRAAEKMRLKNLKKDPASTKTYSYYKCVFCDGYHIGGNVYRRDKK